MCGVATTLSIFSSGWLVSRTGYVSRDEYEIQFGDIFGQIAAYAAGAPANVVNPEALKVARTP